jgi:branched-chain amino acid transport system permease protein
MSVSARPTARSVTGVTRRDRSKLGVPRFADGWPWAVLVVVLAIPLVSGSTVYLTVGTFAALYAMNAIGLTLLYGYAGQISVAQAAFYGIGAYTTGILTANHGWPPLLALVVGVALPTVIAYAIGRPILRLGEFYLALATLAIAEMFVILVKNLSITQGALGIPGIPSLRVGDLYFDTPIKIYLLVSLVLMAVIAFALSLSRSRVGRALHAIRSSAEGAAVLGIPVVEYRTRIFAVAAGLSGLAGGLYAQFVSYISPDTFAPSFSILLLVMIFIGGLRSIWGAVLGAAFLTLLPQWLQDYQKYQVLITGVILVAVLLFMPTGFAGEIPKLVRRFVPRFLARSDGEGVRVVPASSPAAPRTAPTARVNTMLETIGLAKGFGGLKVLTDVSFAVPPGKVVALIGPNGAGKTTCFDILSGLQRPDSGKVLLRGADRTNWPAHRRSGEGIGRTFQDLRLFDDRSVLDNVLVGAHRLGRTGFIAAGLHLPKVRRDERVLSEAAFDALEAVGITHLAGRTVASLPFAQRRLVDLARAIVTRPDLLLLDEPASGLSGPEVVEFRRVIGRIADTGVAILLVEHNMRLVTGMADEVVVLSDGVVVFDGSPDDAVVSPQVLESYLGEGWAARELR